MSELPKTLKLYCVDDTIAIMNRNGKEVVHWMGFDSSYLPLTARKKLARRLVACWNACAGISTEDLEKGERDHGPLTISGLVEVANEAEELERLLGEVKACLHDNLDALDYIGEGQWHEYTGDLVMKEHQWSAINSARKEFCDLFAKLNTRKGG